MQTLIFYGQLKNFNLPLSKISNHLQVLFVPHLKKIIIVIKVIPINNHHRLHNSI